MKLAKSILTILLLLFVGATVGTLIAQEVARPKTRVADGSEAALLDKASVSAVSETSTSEPAAAFPETAVLDEPILSVVDASDGIGATEGISESPALVSSSTVTPCVVEAVYFHNTNRCVTCLKIEGDAKAIVEAEFAEEMAAGKLSWSAINMEEERAYISQYDLVLRHVLSVG